MITREFGQLRDQIATLAAPTPTAPSRIKTPPTDDSDLAAAVRAACNELRELTGVLAADPAATRTLSQMNRVIAALSKQATTSQYKYPG